MKITSVHNLFPAPEDGQDGNDGVSVMYINDYFLISTWATGVTLYGTDGVHSWTTAALSPTKDLPYLWHYQETTLSNGKTVLVPPHCVSHYGQDGNPGKDGTGITDTTITYYQGSSPSSIPGENSTVWSTSMPSPIKGYYMWTRICHLYSDGTKHYAYNLTYNGMDGIDGETIVGPAGKKIIYLHCEWKSNMQYYDGTTPVTINNETYYIIHNVAVTDSSFLTATHWTCKSTHISSATFAEDRDARWTAMQEMGSMYAPLIWVKDAIINYIQAQKAVFGNLVMDAMGANNPNLIPGAFSGKSEFWEFQKNGTTYYGSCDKGIFTLLYNPNLAANEHFQQITSVYNPSIITLEYGKTYTLSANMKASASGIHASIYVLPAANGVDMISASSYGQWLINAYPTTDKYQLYSRTFTVSESWDGMKVRIRLDNWATTSGQAVYVKDLKLEEGVTVTADDHTAELLGYQSQQDMQSRLSNQATLIDGGYIRSALIKVASLIVEHCLVLDNGGNMIMGINHNNDHFLGMYYSDGKKRFGICEDGYLRYYGSDGSELWKIGSGGTIDKNGTIDSWYVFTSISSTTYYNFVKTHRNDAVEVGSAPALAADLTSSAMTLHEFVAGSASSYSDYDGYVSTDNNINNSTVPTSSLAKPSDGYYFSPVAKYVPDAVSDQTYDDVSAWYRTRLHIVNGIVVSQERVSVDTEQDPLPTRE